MRNNSSKREETGAGICRIAVFILGQTKVTCVATWDPRGCVTTTVRDGAEPLVVVAQTRTLATTAALEGISNLNCGCFDLVEIFRSRRLGKNGDDARSSISVTNALFQLSPPPQREPYVFEFLPWQGGRVLLRLRYVIQQVRCGLLQAHLKGKSPLLSSGRLFFQAEIFTFRGLWAFLGPAWA